MITCFPNGKIYNGYNSYISKYLEEVFTYPTTDYIIGTI